jgi:hypothetical protein
MKTQTVASSQRKVDEILPYPPSYINRFMGLIQRLPLPYWVTYLALFILHGFINLAFDWANGWLPAFQFSSLNFIFPLLLWAPLILMTYLDSKAVQAISNFSPLLDLQSEEMQQLKYEFTTMPASGVIWSGLIWTGIYTIYNFLLYPTYEAQGYGTLRIIHTTLDGWVAFLIGYAFIYHTLRQLHLVHRTVKLVKQFNLFRLDPVYAFSALTSKTGIGYILIYTFFTLITPISQDPPILFIAGLVLTVAITLAAFTLPLWVVHQHLVQEKNRLMAEHGQRIKLTLDRLHNCVDENKLDDVVQLNSVMESLNREGNILAKIRTWPWSIETLTGFLSAIVLPIILFLIQIAIQKWLNI